VDAIGSVEGAVNREFEVRLWGNEVHRWRHLGVLDHYSTQFSRDTLLAAWIYRRFVGEGNTHLLKGKHTSKHAIYQAFGIILKMSTVVQQLPDSNAPKTNTQEHCQKSAAKQHKEQVDIGVPQLCDYLSVRPAMSPLVDVREGPKATKVASSSATSF
jgi:hypothetical protein